MIDNILMQNIIRIMEQEQKKSGRGGARAGAGRKPDPSLKIQIRVKPGELEAIKKAAEKTGVTTSTFVKNAVMGLLKDC